MKIAMKFVEGFYRLDRLNELIGAVGHMAHSTGVVPTLTFLVGDCPPREAAARWALAGALCQCACEVEESLAGLKPQEVLQWCVLEAHQEELQELRQRFEKFVGEVKLLLK